MRRMIGGLMLDAGAISAFYSCTIARMPWCPAPAPRAK
jgi:hypothetical protein